MAGARAAGVCPTTVLLLLLAVAFTSSGASDKLPSAVQETDCAAGTEETSDLRPVHHNSGDKEETVDKLVVAEAGGCRDSASGDVAASRQDGKVVAGSDWGKAKKMDDDDDDDDDDDKGDPDSDSDHDHDSDHDSDSDHDHDHDSDCDHDSDHDSDSDSDHDSDSGSDDDHDDDDDDSRHGRKKKHAATGRKGNPGGKHDDELPKK